jgi:hypothetical protein
MQQLSASKIALMEAIPIHRQENGLNLILKEQKIMESFACGRRRGARSAAGLVPSPVMKKSPGCDRRRGLKNQ